MATLVAPIGLRDPVAPAPDRRIAGKSMTFAARSAIVGGQEETHAFFRG